MVPNFGGGYGLSHEGAQPPPIPTVKVLVDNKLGCLLQRFSFDGADTERDVSPAPVNVTQEQPTELCGKNVSARWRIFAVTCACLRVANFGEHPIPEVLSSKRASSIKRAGTPR